MEQHPHVFENWLVNYVFRNRLPFGKMTEHEGSMQNEYVFLCLEFAIIKGLLIGIAGRYREAFCLDHVVKVVQSVAKAIEHYEPLREIINWKGLSEPISMAALLKN
jgi:lysine-N-methylase